MVEPNKDNKCILSIYPIVRMHLLIQSYYVSFACSHHYGDEMNNYSHNVNFLELIRTLFTTLDEHYQKQLIETKEYLEKSNREHVEYLANAQKSMDEMREEYDYHNYDLGVHQELAVEALAAEGELEHFNEIKEIQLLALYEMKTLYLYKEIEIKLKTIISIEYQKNPKKLSSLNQIDLCFQKQGVLIDKLKGYQQVDNLRKVANDLKHSLQINQSKNIPEFKGRSEFNAPSLQRFMESKLYELEVFFEELNKMIKNESYDPFVEIEDGIPF